ITCAITEPISEKRITTCINDIANAVVCILGAVAIVTLMLIISITLIISAGNVTAMLR
ncbi:MAG: stage III sporulation protein AE, partial [Clostridiaceae bacterium]|nr:stage III sporulation protein AE [Clostridiaceae bacterium]